MIPSARIFTWGVLKFLFLISFALLMLVVSEQPVLLALVNCWYS